MAPDDRTGNQAASKLFEDEHCVGVAETDPAVFLGKPEREHAHLGELAPERAVDALRLLEVGKAFVRDLAFDEAADAFAQGLLIFGGLEIHVSCLEPRSGALGSDASGWLAGSARDGSGSGRAFEQGLPHAGVGFGSFGSPRMRSPMMFFWI